MYVCSIHAHHDGDNRPTGGAEGLGPTHDPFCPIDNDNRRPKCFNSILLFSSRTFFLVGLFFYKFNVLPFSINPSYCCVNKRRILCIFTINMITNISVQISHVLLD